jgi:hypothetical protein
VDAEQHVGPLPPQDRLPRQSQRNELAGGDQAVLAAGEPQDLSLVHSGIEADLGPPPHPILQKVTLSGTFCKIAR